MADRVEGIRPLPLDPTLPSLDARAELIVPADAGAIMIPERAFHAALARSVSGERASSLGGTWSARIGAVRQDDPAPRAQAPGPPAFGVDAVTRVRAIALASIANEPGTIGIVGDIQDNGGPLAFIGQLFIVVRDPLVDPATGRIESTDYDVVAVELSGSTPWIGTGARFAQIPASASLGPCCGPAMKCFSVPDNPPPCDFSSYCVSPFFGVTSKVPDLLEERAAAGKPVVRLSIFENDLRVAPTGLSAGIEPGREPRFRRRSPSRRSGAGPPPPEGSARAAPGVVPLNFICITTVDPQCTELESWCVEPGDSDSGQVKEPGTNPCGAGGSPSRGRDVPEICTQIFAPEGLPPECGGWCPSCGEPPADLIPPECTVMAFFEVPEWCQKKNPLADKLKMQAKAGWAPGLRSARTCEGTGRGEVEVCIECDGGGNCRETVRKPKVNPIAAATSGTRERNWVTFEPSGSGGYRLKPPEPSEQPKAKPEPTKAKPTKPKPPEEAPPPAKVPESTAESTPKPEVKQRKPLVPPPGTAEPGPTGPGPDEPGEEKAPDEPSEVQTSIRSDWFGPEDLVRNNTVDESGDPVLLGNGSFHIQQLDLDFPGPVRELRFVRTYDSRSRMRSFLGSNWTHSWDVRLQILTAETVPAWAAPYCAGAPGTTTCLLLHEGDGSTEMYCLDTQTRLFMPQAGGTGTIAQVDGGGWALRRPDGHVRFFDQFGCLVVDRDRFGNGFSIEYEPTPLFELYRYHCAPDKLKAPTPARPLENRPMSPLGAMRPRPGDVQVVTPPATTGLLTKYSRPFAVLAYLNEDAVKPRSTDPAWQLTAQDLPLPDRQDDPMLYDRLAYARALLFSVLALGPDAQVPCGFRRFRPTRVTDDLGRTLEFSYYAPAARINLGGGPPSFDFASMRESELLERVEGPAGTSVRFTYGRPEGYPPELNESFLIQVDRQDSRSGQDIEPAPRRQIDFRYQWPGSGVESYEPFTSSVYRKFFAYFATYVGCWYKDRFDCDGEIVLGERIFAPGDPAALARNERNAFISNVADNIIQVIANDVTESETRYVTDPESQTFDRVTAQRYGSEVAGVPSDGDLDNWQTNLPKLVLSYQEAGPASADQMRLVDPNVAVAGGIRIEDEPIEDRTDLFLPREIRERYPLETMPVFPEATGVAPVVGAVGSDQDCNFALMETVRRDLPGYWDTVRYYDVEEAQAHPNLERRLCRSRLDSNQLAMAQASDPTHNDLLSVFEPELLLESIAPARNALTEAAREASEAGERRSYIARRLLGRRQLIAANMNRICSWTQVVDRDGDLRFYGLNYRGQVLVDAVKERSSESFIFSERIYNADGLVVQLRRPTRGAQPWSPSAGYTEYTYDEIDPSGNRGWNDWLPVFWGRRGNLLRVGEIAAGVGVLNADEASDLFSSSLGRYRKYAYEPLFNQIMTIEEGSIELAPSTRGGLAFEAGDIPHSQVEFIFDYQELDWDQPDSVASILDELRPWGFDWITTRTGAYDYEAIGDWQLPLDFYGADINQDGSLGFAFGSDPADRAKGVPILAYRSPPGSVGDIEGTRMAWAPNGKPAAVQGADGSLTLFDYYSLIGLDDSSPYGPDSRPPSDWDVDGGFGGFLARIRSLRFPAEYPTDFGPSEAPCPVLPGPYQWLLPATVTSSPRSALVALGLPEEAVEAILNSGQPDGVWLTTSIGYSELGRPRKVWDDLGVRTTARDTDGRPLRETNARGTVTEYEYTVHGSLRFTTRTDRDGNRMGEEYREFDGEGRLTYECVALSAGGCEPLGSPQPSDGVVHRFTYWPEGTVRSVVDPEGLLTQFRYNERQLLIHELSTSPTSTGEWRGTSYEYNLDGQPVAIHFGDETGDLSGLLTERFGYDGLGRLVTHTDTRGFGWQSAYSSRDLLAREKRDDVPYGSPGLPPSWETVIDHDDMGRAFRRTLNGSAIDKVERGPGGFIFRRSSEGIGDTYITYDSLGREAWIRDPAGNETIRTWRPTPHDATETVISKDKGGTTLTTAMVRALDVEGLPLQETYFGSGIRRKTNFERDGGGLVSRRTDPEGHVTTNARNWLGWLVGESVQADDANPPTFDVASFDYNRRGQLRQVTDPSGQVTDVVFDPFGAIRTRTTPGQPTVVSAFEYDSLGRLVSEQIGGVTVRHDWDRQGDPIRERVRDGRRWRPLIERSFDDLGRLYRVVNHNHALSWLPESERDVGLDLKYDQLGRVKFESIQVGSMPPGAVSSAWSPAVGGVWERRMQYPARAETREWLETYDRAGRLARKARVLSTGGVLETTFDWLGYSYAGRSQQQLDRPSPFRERLDLDAFGMEGGRTYSAIDLDGLNQPLDPAEGVAYCRGPWSLADCTEPLLQTSILRDIEGRVSSLKQKFGYPRISDGFRLPGAHPTPWHGYTYTARGHLNEVFEHLGEGTEVSDADFDSYAITAGDVQALGAPYERWEYLREQAVGGSVRISRPNTAPGSWSLPTPRGVGHQIRQLEIDEQVRNLVHDAAGRVVTDGVDSYEYDPRGQLAAVKRGGAVLEAYAYDGLGRLVSVLVGTQPPEVAFLYDDTHIVTASDRNGDPYWEAAWGPELDQLIEWRDYVGGSGDHIPMVDHLGSVWGLWSLDASAVMSTAQYNAEGRMLIRDSEGRTTCQEEGSNRICGNVSGLPFGFLTAWRSSVTGLVYFRNRWYSPELAQFTSQDREGFRDSYNPYAYAGFDPVNRTDPFGLTSSGPADTVPKGQAAPRKPSSLQDDFVRRMTREVGTGLAADVLERLPVYGDVYRSMEFVDEVRQFGWRKPLSRLGGELLSMLTPPPIALLDLASRTNDVLESAQKEWAEASRLSGTGNEQLAKSHAENSASHAVDALKSALAMVGIGVAALGAVRAGGTGSGAGRGTPKAAPSGVPPKIPSSPTPDIPAGWTRVSRWESPVYAEPWKQAHAVPAPKTIPGMPGFARTDVTLLGAAKPGAAKPGAVRVDFNVRTEALQSPRRGAAGDWFSIYSEGRWVEIWDVKVNKP